jgi:putative heme-binding domain-containing protein
MTDPALFSARLCFLALFLTLATLFTYSPVAAKSTQASDGASRGQAVFEGKGNCLSCHRVADQGSYMGPDLSAIGSSRTPEELRKALLSPNAEVAPQHRLYRAVTRNGKAITGRILNQDIYIIQMLTSDEHLLTLKKSGLRSFNFIDTPPMPSYRDKLTAAEQADLIAYLASLQGVIKQ